MSCPVQHPLPETVGPRTAEELFVSDAPFFVLNASAFFFFCFCSSHLKSNRRRLADRRYRLVPKGPSGGSHPPTVPPTWAQNPRPMAPEPRH